MIELIKHELAKRHADDIEAYYDIIWDAALEWANILAGKSSK